GSWPAAPLLRRAIAEFDRLELDKAQESLVAATAKLAKAKPEAIAAAARDALRLSGEYRPVLDILHTPDRYADLQKEIQKAEPNSDRRKQLAEELMAFPKQFRLPLAEDDKMVLKLRDEVRAMRAAKGPEAVLVLQAEAAETLL